MTRDDPGRFTPSRPFTIGVELEFMLADRATGQLASESPALLRDLEDHECAPSIKAEITQSMIELNSGVHETAESLEAELRRTCADLKSVADGRQLELSGGGAHPFRDWPQRDIFPEARFDRLYEIYGYLVKKFTVFGQHIHVGLGSADDAIYLTHVFNGLVPHFIALAAASPFQRGVDTAFQSSRLDVISTFPLSGHLPDVPDWCAFAGYYSRMHRTGLVTSMKDFYWDVRPKPEFGTVEIRVCDTPLTLVHAVDLAALAQAIARCYLDLRPRLDTSLQYDAYSVNRFKAARFACNASILDVEADRVMPLAESLESLIERCLPYCADAAAAARLERLRARVRLRHTDADWMRAVMERNCDWTHLMSAQSERLLEPAETAAH